MLLFGSYFAGLATAHLAWLYFFTTGQLLRRVSKEPRSFSLADLVITSVAGMALSGFGLLALGFTHLLNVIGIVILLVTEVVLFWILKRHNWLSLTFGARLGSASSARGQCRRFLLRTLFTASRASCHAAAIC
jgi:hypothetical protein